MSVRGGTDTQDVHSSYSDAPRGHGKAGSTDTTWRNLGNSLLRESSQSQKATYYTKCLERADPRKETAGAGGDGKNRQRPLNGTGFLLQVVKMSLTGS